MNKGQSLAGVGLGVTLTLAVAPVALVARAAGCSHTFAYTGATQTCTLDPGVTSVTITAVGATGGRNSSAVVIALGGLGWHAARRRSTATPA